jgi:hypothetical protein
MASPARVPARARDQATSLPCLAAAKPIRPVKATLRPKTTPSA